MIPPPRLEPRNLLPWLQWSLQQRAVVVVSLLVVAFGLSICVPTLHEAWVLYLPAVVLAAYGLGVRALYGVLLTIFALMGIQLGYRAWNHLDLDLIDQTLAASTILVLGGLCLWHLRVIEQRELASERYLRRLCDCAPVGIAVTDQNGSVIHVNSAGLRILNLPAEEGLGDRWIQHVHPDDRAAVVGDWQRYVRGESPNYQEEFRLVQPDQYRWVRCRVAPIQDDDLSPLGFIVTLDDVTESKLHEAEARAAAERIRQQAALLDAANDAIMVRDLEERIMYWSGGAERLYGWTAAEAVGQRAVDLFYPESTADQEAAQRAVLDKEEWTGELRHVTKAGREIIVASRWTLLRDEEGRPKGKLILNSNITEKKQHEAEVLRLQRLESIGTLAGGIAHDLNNVLAPIMMSVDILKMKHNDPATLSILDILSNSTQRGADLIRQVLSFARGTPGQRHTLSLHPLVNELTKLLRQTFPRSIEVEMKVAEDTWHLSADATQIHQVLMNLCVNARDAMPDGGHLTIVTRNVMADAAFIHRHPEAQLGPYVCLSVCDTGAGIPPEIQERVFEPFFTTKNVGEGTGLGLPIVVGIVKAHGGFITLKSTVGAGSCFEVYLPADQPGAEQAQRQTLQDVCPGRGEMVLVVDDEPAIREIARSTLTAYGYQVMTATQGKEAVELYAQMGQNIHVVITDMIMPVMDGGATIRSLRTLNPQVRIIAASGLNDSLPEDPTQLGVADILSKPFTAPILLQTIRQVLDKP
ncbi:MAG: PAS domain S-box protein [Gemmataceae bacterium]